ncbi:MAG: ABC transporter permease [Vicinamibacteria bacterium]|nr:ABC transporter permease [Vicinamibacteria bacterium]
MRSFALDLRQALRGLARRPSFAVAATLTLGLASGAATAVYSVVDAALLAPLPYADAARLVRVYENDTLEGRRFGQVTIADFRDWRASSRTLSGLSAIRVSTATLTGRGEAQRLPALRVSAAFFDVLGVRPALGRGFRDEEEGDGAAAVVVITHGLFARAFGADPAVLGTAITLDAVPTTIVGVLPEGFRSPTGFEAEVYLPDAFEALFQDANRARRMHFLAVVGRLAPGADFDAAGAELEAIGARIEAAHPRDNKGHRPLAVPLRESLHQAAGPMMQAVSAAVLLLLTLAAVNVAGLALARALARPQDVAVRGALGASALQAARVPLLENLVVAAAGGGLGVVLAAWGADGLAALAGPELAPSGAAVSWRLLAFGVLSSALVGLGCGLAPALAARRVELVGVLKAATPGAGRGGRLGARGALVGVQVALASVLLVVGGLLARTVVALGEVDPGFRAEGVLSFRTSLAFARYPDAAARTQATLRLRDQIAALPGVTQVGFGYTLPVGNMATTSFVIDGLPQPADAPPPEVGYNSASPGYFEAIGVPLLRGRLFEARDGEGGPLTVLVNQTLAERYFPGQDPVGRRLRTGPDRELVEVIGVVGDVRRAGLDATPVPELFESALQGPSPSPLFVVRAEASAYPALPQAVRDAARAVDPDLALYSVQGLDEVLDRMIAPRRLLLILVGAFGASALLLAGLGVFGVTAQLVAQTQREIAVRMALGAPASDVVRRVVRRGLRPVGLGLLAGTGAAIAAGRALGATLFGVTPTDPLTHAAALGLLLVTATLACLVPARRAVNVAPSDVLRGD